MFGFDMITANKFTTAQIDKNTWSEEMLDLLMEFIKTDPRAEKYRGLDWSHERLSQKRRSDRYTIGLVRHKQAKPLVWLCLF